MAIKTLHDLSQLRDSNFGWPKPRHGLQLLFWFAHDFVKFRSNQMVVIKDPSSGTFGFQCFHNRADDGSPLLPPPSFGYFEVGDLTAPNASQFPEYVREQHSHCQDESNGDRIIVDMNGRNVSTVYITHLSDLDHFSRMETYCISQGLINIIKGTSLGQFLSTIDSVEDPIVPQSGNMDPPKYLPISQSGDMDPPRFLPVSQSGYMDPPRFLPVSQSGYMDPPKYLPISQSGDMDPPNLPVSQSGYMDPQKPAFVVVDVHSSNQLTVSGRRRRKQDSCCKSCIICIGVLILVIVVMVIVGKVVMFF